MFKVVEMLMHGFVFSYRRKWGCKNYIFVVFVYYRIELYPGNVKKGSCLTTLISACPTAHMCKRLDS